jgi:hypothetical protein
VLAALNYGIATWVQKKRGFKEGQWIHKAEQEDDPDKKEHLSLLAARQDMEQTPGAIK